MGDRCGKSPAAWGWEQRKSPQAQQADNASSAEMRRLQSEFKRVTEERDILKKAASYFAKLSG